MASRYQRALLGLPRGRPTGTVVPCKRRTSEEINTTERNKARNAVRAGRWWTGLLRSGEGIEQIEARNRAWTLEIGPRGKQGYGRLRCRHPPFARMRIGVQPPSSGRFPNQSRKTGLVHAFLPSARCTSTRKYVSARSETFHSNSVTVPKPPCATFIGPITDITAIPITGSVFR